MDLAPLTALGTLIFAFVNFLKYCSVKNWNGAVTQLIAWGAGVGGILLVAKTTYAAAIVVGNVPLQSMNLWSKVFVGLMATSLLTTLNEGYKAIDITNPTINSAKAIKLFPRLDKRNAVTVGSTESSVNTTVTSSPSPQPSIPPHRTNPPSG